LCICILGREERRAGAHWRPSLWPQTHAMTGRPVLKLPEYDLRSRKTAFACAVTVAGFLDRPGQSRLDRCRRLVNV
jgi:hypothetical protein